MNDLAEVLRAQAAVSHPRADLDDAVRRSDARHRRVVAVRAAATVAAVVVVALGVAAATLALRHDGAPRPSVVAGRPPALPALVIGDPAEHALDRRDVTAEQGPWTVVVRRAGGSLGSHGAVVTFPVEDVAAARPVTVNGNPGRMGAGQIVWSIAGAHARVRGDLPDAQLLQIARATSIVGGRPSVRPPHGTSVVSTAPYRAPVVHEARYGSDRLGEARDLGNGLTYTGVLRAGGFEDRLYATGGRHGYRVDGHPAVLSSLQGGNATLAWEPSPGVVAYVGYSGSTPTQGAVDALIRLAERARFVSARAWQAARPQAADQVNDFT